MRASVKYGVICILVGCLAHVAKAVEPAETIKLHGQISEPADLSGLALHRGLLVVCPDEGAQLNLFKRESAATFEALPPIKLLDDDKAEIDMEGVASDGRFVFVVGSHSRVRKKLEADRPYAKNRERIAQIDDQTSRDSLFRLEFDQDGQCTARHSISLRKILHDNEILAPFTKLPGKENGIDLEGIAAADGKLYLGFRGPVLRGNYVPIISFRYEQPEDYQLLFVNLGGHGIRDLAAVAGGLLVLAGPLGDGDGSHELYFWNGQDCVPGEASPQGKVTHVAALKSSGGAKPEGIAVVAEANGEIQLLVVCDGATDARVEQIRVAVPR